MDLEWRIVLVGRTGAGKSSTGNNILQRQAFESSACGTSVTRKCQWASGMRSGIRLEIVDSPGLFDTSMSQEDITREIVKCIGMTAPGPHAFVIVIRIDRFTKEEQDTVAHLQQVFGERMLDHLTVLFTRKDDLTNDGSTIDQYVQKAPPALQTLLKACNNRYVAFNNRGSDEERNRDVHELFQRIEETVRCNGGAYYTSSMYEEAERIMQMREQQIRRERKEAVDRQRKEIEEECQSKLKDIESNHNERSETMETEIKRLETLTCSQTSEEVKCLQKQLEEMKMTLEETRAELAETKAKIGREGTMRREQCTTNTCDTRQQARDEVNREENVIMNLLKIFQSEEMKPIVSAVKIAIATGISQTIGNGFEMMNQEIRRQKTKSQPPGQGQSMQGNNHSEPPKQ